MSVYSLFRKALRRRIESTSTFRVLISLPSKIKDALPEQVEHSFYTLFAPLILKPQSLKKPEPGKDWQTALVLLQRLLFPRETRDIGASGPWGLVSRLQGPRDFTSHGFKNPECHPLP